MVGGGKGRGVFRGEKTVVEGGGEGGAGVDEVVIDGREEMGGDGGCGEGEEDEERERVEDFHGCLKYTPTFYPFKVSKNQQLKLP